MPTMAKTDERSCKFTVKEDGEGTPWIAIEDGSLPCVGDGFLGFVLRPGTTHKQARELSTLLNGRIQSITHTLFAKEISQNEPF